MWPCVEILTLKTELHRSPWHSYNIVRLIMENCYVLKCRRSRNRDVVFFSHQILLPCQNLAPSLPTMHFNRWWHKNIRYIMSEATNITLPPCRHKEQATDVQTQWLFSFTNLWFSAAANVDSRDTTWISLSDFVLLNKRLCTSSFFVYALVLTKPFTQTL